MGFFKERKRAKELETTYKLMVELKKELKELDIDSADLDVQAICDKCEDILTKISSSKTIVKEDMADAQDHIANGWFATRDAYIDEYKIHKKRLAILGRDEKVILSYLEKMIEKGAKPSEAYNAAKESVKAQEKAESEKEFEFC